MSRYGSRSFLLLIFLVLILVVCGCIQKIDRPASVDYSSYFPLNEGDWREFSGPLGKSVVTTQTNNIFTFSYYDSLGELIGWKDFVRGESGTYLKNIISITPEMPSVFYEPALRFSPWSDIIGDTLFQTSTEISLDSTNTHLNVMAEYKIVAKETVVCEAGTFSDCIKVEVNYEAPEETVNKIYDGITEWWFAPNVGLVKYTAFRLSGELLSASIDGVSYP